MRSDIREFTEQERIYIEEMVKHGNPAIAVREAKYRNQTQAKYDLACRVDVSRMIAHLVEAEIAKGRVLGIGRINQMLTNPATTNRDVINAYKAIEVAYDKRSGANEGTAKLQDMSAAELAQAAVLAAQRVMQLKAQADATIEGDPVSKPALPVPSDIFD